MPTIISLRDFCRDERPWLLETIEALVSLESPTTDKAAVDQCGRALAARLEAIGGRVSRLPRADRGDHLLAEFGCGTSQILLLGHFDTVWPVGQLERMPLVRSNGRLHGPGVFDMKAGIAIGMLATRALLETGVSLSRRIVMLWTTDEEVGSATSRAAIEDEARRSDAVLVLEPSLPGGAVKTARKGAANTSCVFEAWRRTPASIRRRARARFRIGAPDRPRAEASGPRSGHLGQRRHHLGRHAHERCRRGGACGGRRARADAGRRGACGRGVPRAEGRGRADGRIGDRRLGSSPAGTNRPGGASVPAGVRSRARARPGAWRGKHRWRFGREFHRCSGCCDVRWPRRGRRRAHALHEHVEIESLSDRAALVAGLIARIQLSASA